MPSPLIFDEQFELNFFASNELEQATIPEQGALITGRNILRLLMMGWQNHWRQLISWDTFNAVFIERDLNLTRGMRLAMQEGFHHVYSQLKDANLNEEQRNKAELFISNCLTLLPFADLTPFETISIPQYLDGKWQMVEYKVTPIELTPTQGFKKIFLAENDRVFAYGLEPLDQDNAEPHLIFMGTTYPAGQGFQTQINTDLEAFETAGKKLYRSGRERILNWLKSQPKKAHVCGTSLGGSLSLLLATDIGGEYISRVDALNPPGLYDAWEKSQYDRWDEHNDKPPVFIQKQKNDPVSQFGKWKEDWQILQVTPPEENEGPNALTAHALNYAGIKGTKIEQINTIADNKERESRNFWLYTVARSLFYYAILVPHRYFFLPLFRFANNHKLHLLFFIPLAILFSTLAPVGAIYFVFTVLSAFITSYALQGITKYIGHLFSERIESGLADFMSSIEENRGLKIAFYIALATAALMIVTFTLTNTYILLPLTAAIGFCFLATNLFLESFNIAKIFLGLNNIDPPLHQNPKLERNKEMDIYDNKMDVTLKVGDIKTYYQIQRCNLKGKELIPEIIEDKEDKYGLLMLLDSYNDEPVKVTANKAKIHHIQQLLRFGIHASKTTLEEAEAKYQEGKNGIKTEIDFERGSFSIS